eukprot:COSAG02_NODE_24385_length_690_cov_0.866328_2_plen_29_part_01
MNSILEYGSSIDTMNTGCSNAHTMYNVMV